MQGVGLAFFCVLKFASTRPLPRLLYHIFYYVGEGPLGFRSTLSCKTVCLMKLEPYGCSENHWKDCLFIYIYEIYEFFVSFLATSVTFLVTFLRNTIMLQGKRKKDVNDFRLFISVIRDNNWFCTQVNFKGQEKRGEARWYFLLYCLPNLILLVYKE